MLSERSYWIILIVTFAGIALLIWLWFIPYGIVEYNLGVNLLTSSIFMVLTIVFLSWLFKVRERIQWKTVKDEVHGSIQDNLGRIFDRILDIVEGGLKTKHSILLIQDVETRKEVSLFELCKLKDAKEIRFETIMLKEFLGDRESVESLLDVKRRIGDIERKYLRFLSPQLTISLMKIQTSIELLDTASRLYITVKKSKELDKTVPSLGQELKNMIPEMVSLPLKRLMEEIYNIHRMGIEFFYL